MHAYKYKGVSPDGKPVSGEIVASSAEEAERRVTAQDVTIIAILPAGARRGGTSESQIRERSNTRSRHLPASEAAAILDSLAVMAETGVPFVEALDAVAGGVKSPLVAKQIRLLRDEIVGGRSLSSAMRSVDNLFPPLVADMVRVAEEGGRLDHALRGAAGYLERQAELKKRVMNAMLYPAVMLGISALTVLILVIVVIPQFAGIFVKMGVEIPLATQLMLSSGEFIRHKPWHCVGLVIGGLLLIRWLLRNPSTKIAISKATLKLPILGDLLRKLAYSRSFHSLATLLSGNVSIIAAMEHSARVAGNIEVEKAFMDAKTAVEHGKTLADALGDTKVVPATILQIVAVGERTGRLAPVLTTTAASMERDIDARLKALVTIIEPVMIVFMGLIIGGITVSIIGPIYSVVQNIK